MTVSFSYLVILADGQCRAAPRCSVTTSASKISWLISNQPIHLICNPAKILSSRGLFQRGRIGTPCGLTPLRATPTEISTSTANSNFDAVLLLAETICLVFSAVVVIGHAVNCAFPAAAKTLFGTIFGSLSALAWGVASLTGCVILGSWIRRRHGSSRMTLHIDGRQELNLVGRVEKLEEELKQSINVIRVLSRQLEKLGIRFRVTRKVLKGPITETAALAQKNSEVTRELAFQEEALERELGEMQKVLLAMQEQQQKQLELILAIGSAAVESNDSTPRSSSDSNHKFDRTEASVNQTSNERVATKKNE